MRRRHLVWVLTLDPRSLRDWGRERAFEQQLQEEASMAAPLPLLILILSHTIPSVVIYRAPTGCLIYPSLRIHQAGTVSPTTLPLYR